MPSISHEALLLLFRNRPELAPELLRDALHVALPAYSGVRIESADLTDLAPAEYRADLVVLLVEGKPVLGIVVEVQLQRDDRKRFTWPVYTWRASAPGSSAPRAFWWSRRATRWPTGAARPSTSARAEPSRR